MCFERDMLNLLQHYAVHIVYGPLIQVVLKVFNQINDMALNDTAIHKDEIAHITACMALQRHRDFCPVQPDRRHTDVLRIKKILQSLYCGLYTRLFLTCRNAFS